jgi:hypothetical protein
MTALEGCSYFGIEKCCRVVADDHPQPPFDQESIAMRPLKEVVWSIVGAKGSPRNDDGAGDIDEVLRQAEMFDNVTGGVLDDFFCIQRMEIFKPDNVARVNKKLKSFKKRPLDLWVVVYEHELELALAEYFEHCDVITFWTWCSENLADLDDNFKKVKAMAPGKRFYMGCYMYDYGNQQQMPMEMMELQCRKYQKWMQDGEIEGIILCSNCCADVNFEAVEWTRNWINDNFA